MELSVLFKVINKIKKWNNSSGDFRARSNPAKFLISEKVLEKSLKLCVLMLTFNSSTQKTETGGSVSLRPDSCSEKFSEQPNLSSQENHGEEKASEAVIE